MPEDVQPEPWPEWRFPELCAATTQQQIDVGINGFAVTLLAESFAHHRERWGNETLALIGWGKDREPVYITVSSIPPRPPASSTAESAEGPNGEEQDACPRCGAAIPLEVMQELDELWSQHEGDAPQLLRGQHGEIFKPYALLTYCRACAPAVQVCRVCSCTDEDACEGGCEWVAPDLCSRCAQ